MYPVSARYLEAVRNPPTIATRVEVWYGGHRVDTYGDQGLPVYGGQAQVDRTKQVRRTLTGVQVDATDDTWNLLSPVGTQLRCFRGFRYLNGETELIPVGVFTLDSLSETYGGAWDGSIDTAPDLMALVQRARFLTPRTFPAGMRISDVIATLLTEVLGSTYTNLATSDAVLLTDAVYQRDRGKAITDLAASIGVDVFCAPDGTPTIRDIPKLSDPVWDVDAGDTGVLYQATRQRTADQSYSAVVASGTQINGATPFPPQVVYDDNPLSPTYYLGPFGLVPYYMSSDLFTDAGMAMSAAIGRLPLVTGPRAQFSLTAECNAALDGFDTVRVTLPARGRGQSPVVERHLVDTLTVPMTPAATQAITTSSTVADIPGSE